VKIEEIAPEALKLSPMERAALAASLWESIGDPYRDCGGESDDEAVALAISRDREMDNGEVKPVPFDEVMKRLRR